MKPAKRVRAAAEPLLELDRKAREAFIPYRETPVVEAISFASKLGDQPQLRILSGGLIAVGLVRSDPRMIRAGARMLLAHELATLAKKVVKHRVDRLRPRSATTREEQKPKRGRHRTKEQSSFPSGHSAGALAAALAFSAEYPEHKGAAVVAASAIGAAQVPRSAHYPTDVAAGMAIGAAAHGVAGLLWRAGAALWRRNPG